MSFCDSFFSPSSSVITSLPVQVQLVLSSLDSRSHKLQKFQKIFICMIKKEFLDTEDLLLTRQMCIKLHQKLNGSFVLFH